MIHHNLAHKLIPVPQATKIPNAKAAVEKGFLEAQRAKKKKSTLLHWWTSELEPKLLRHKGRVVLEGFTEQSSSAAQTTAAKNNGCYCKIARLWRTSSRRHIGTHSSKIGGCSQTAQKIQSQNVHKYGYVFHDTNGQKSWAKIEDPVIPLERNLYGHPFAGLLWQRQFEEAYFKEPVVLQERNLHGHPLAGRLWERHFEKVLLELGCEKSIEWQLSICFVHGTKGILRL